jgi:putative phosphoribosyl transferase
MMHAFADRVEAGQQLAAALKEYRGRQDVTVLGLPRGGVPVAFEVAESLAAPLDVMIVRKIGAPYSPEFALGAIASGGVVVMNADVPSEWIDNAAVEATVAAERLELERRERRYRAGRQSLKIRDRTVILVDDGAATGSSMLAAVRAVKALGAGSVVVALPVASLDAADKLRGAADRVVCLGTPTSFSAVGQWYVDFAQTSDAEVQTLLERASGKGNPV